MRRLHHAPIEKVFDELFNIAFVANQCNHFQGSCCYGISKTSTGSSRSQSGFKGTQPDAVNLIVCHVCPGPLNVKRV